MGPGGDDPVTTTDGLMQAGPFAHHALFYRSRDEYTREVCSFVREGLSAAEPALVAVPGRRLDLVRAALGEAGEAGSVADTAPPGPQPAPLLPAPPPVPRAPPPPPPPVRPAA